MDIFQSSRHYQQMYSYYLDYLLLSKWASVTIGADFFLSRAKDALEVGPLRGLGQRFGAYWSQKVQLWWQQFLLIFLRTNVIFYT